MYKNNSIHVQVVSFNLFYGKKQILYDINLNIYKKKVTALIGQSGCGKSSLLRAFNRMNDYTDGSRSTGEIKIDNNNIYSRQFDVTLLRAKVGMVFQKPNPFPKSIYDNISYAPRLYGIKSNQLDRIVEDSLRKVGLWEEVADHLKENAFNLSGGQQQRLCIARAIAVKPTILLMDEPCSALDPRATAAIEKLIKELKEKFTIIVVTHSMEQASRIADFTTFLHKGKIVDYNKTEIVLRNPYIQELLNPYGTT